MQQNEENSPSFGSKTDIGHVRDHNEDSLLVSPPLFVVADGMGGHAAGEVASEIVVETLDELAPRTADADALVHAIEAANLNVIKAPRQGVGRIGMGTTCTAAVVTDDRLLIAQVGDSRAYLLHGNHLQQLTRDHSLMADLIEAGTITPEQARSHPDRSVITRAIGSDPYMLPDVYELNVADGDRLLLCSDGLSGMVRDEQIEQIMRRNRDPQHCADQLVEAALRAGGFDNVTVIVVDVHNKEVHRKLERKAKRHYRTLAAFAAVAIVAVFALAAFGFNQYVHDSAYLVEEDGTVSLYRGLPDTFLGMSFSQLEEKTDIPVDELPAGVANRIREGMAAGSIGEARELLSTYRADIANARIEAAKSAIANGGSAANAQDGSQDASGNAQDGSQDAQSGSQGTQGSQGAQGSASDDAHGTLQGKGAGQ